MCYGYQGELSNSPGCQTDQLMDCRLNEGAQRKKVCNVASLMYLDVFEIYSLGKKKDDDDDGKGEDG